MSPCVLLVCIFYVEKRISGPIMYLKVFVKVHYISIFRGDKDEPGVKNKKWHSSECFHLTVSGSPVSSMFSGFLLRLYASYVDWRLYIAPIWEYVCGEMQSTVYSHNLPRIPRIRDPGKDQIITCDCRFRRFLISLFTNSLMRVP